MPRASVLVALLAISCGGGAPALSITVHGPAGPGGLALATADLADTLAALAHGPVERDLGPAPACQPHQIHLEVAEPDLALGPGYRIDEVRCGDGKRISLRGGSLLAGQWAVYRLLDRLGVRYFHPEETLLPPRLAWPAAPLTLAERPAFQQRSIHVHRTHPVELSPPLATQLDMAAYQRRWIDWAIRNRLSDTDGYDEALVGDYARRRGLPRSASLNLLNSQQGSRPVLDPADPRPEHVQLADAIEHALAGSPPPTQLTVQFNPSEFTEADDLATVDRLTFIADYLREHHPEVEVETINHGTAGKRTPHLGLRFYDLPELAPTNLTVAVHPLMLYDLERPAPVYGNSDFRNLRDWTRRQARVRRIIYYPESSWWLTFDLPVPLYLAPATLEARQHDIDLLRGQLSPEPAARTGVYGHHLFSSGQEWGYWLVDWCFARMSWDVAYTKDRCLGDFTGALAGGAELRAVLAEVEARQVVDVRDPDRLRLLVGSDDATETAALAGIRLHPLPPRMADLMDWDDAQAAAFRARSVEPMLAMAADYARWADRVTALLPGQGPAQAPLVREVADGLRIFGLRAAHAGQLYGTALALRAARARGDAAATALARLGLAEAENLTEQARAVVRARERDYRYPAELTIAGDEADSPGALANRTIYPYRYLGRTHRLYYWVRPDRELRALLDAPPPPPRAASAGVARRLVFPRGSLHVAEPKGADLIDGLLPALELGLGPGFLELGSLEGGPPQRRARHGNHSGPADLGLTVPRVGTITIYRAVLDLSEAGLEARGELATGELIQRLVAVGGFDAVGARRMIAGVLGYPADRLPLRVPFRATGQAAPQP